MRIIVALKRVLGKSIRKFTPVCGRIAFDIRMSSAPA